MFAIPSSRYIGLQHRFEPRLSICEISVVAHDVLLARPYPPLLSPVSKMQTKRNRDVHVKIIWRDSREVKEIRQKKNASYWQNPTLPSTESYKRVNPYPSKQSTVKSRGFSHVSKVQLSCGSAQRSGQGRRRRSPRQRSASHPHRRRRK